MFGEFKHKMMLRSQQRLDELPIAERPRRNVDRVAMTGRQLLDLIGNPRIEFKVVLGAKPIEEGDRANFLHPQQRLKVINLIV